MSEFPAAVDLNADVGEMVDGADAALMSIVTSANIACGAHAGDPTLMRATVKLASAHDVAIGAHPGFIDRDHFGRRELTLSSHEVEDLTLYQIGALAAIAAAEGSRLRHVKAHGGLYNLAARDAATADALARATAVFDSSLMFVGLAGSELIAAGRRAGLRTVSEVFADRAYHSDGSLVSRQRAGAVIHDADVVVQRAVRMVRDGVVESIEGDLVTIEAETICVHGDTPDAARLAGEIRRALEAAGIAVRSVRL